MTTLHGKSQRGVWGALFYTLCCRILGVYVVVGVVYKERRVFYWRVHKANVIKSDYTSCYLPSSSIKLTAQASRRDP